MLPAQRVGVKELWRQMTTAKRDTIRGESAGGRDDLYPQGDVAWMNGYAGGPIGGGGASRRNLLRSDSGLHLSPGSSGGRRGVR